MSDDIEYLDPGGETFTIMGLFGRECYVLGVGCSPTLAYIDLEEVHTGRMFRVGMARIGLEDGAEDWSFGVTQIGGTVADSGS